MKPIYLDYNATTPLLPAVADAMRPFLENMFGNPSSSHYYGMQTKIAVQEARTQVAALLNCNPAEIIFTSGGSESNNMAIKGIAEAYQNKGNHIITSAIEHPAVSEVCLYLEKKGFEITRLNVGLYGKIDMDELKKSIKKNTILITIMHANNEVGTIQPIAEIAELIRARNIILHTDAAQSVGKIETDVKNLGVDLLSIAGHKFYGPKGIGALYIKQGTVLAKQIHGADHEQNMRAGTENIMEIAGLGKAAEIANNDLKENAHHMKKMRDMLCDKILSMIDPEYGETDLINYYKPQGKVKINGHPQYGLPNTLSISFKGIEANVLLSEIESKVAASAGAACHSDDIDVSATLTAMDVPVEYAMGTIRFSTGRMTTEKDVMKAAQIVSGTVKKLQKSDILVPQTEDTEDIKLTHYTQGLGCACKLRPQVLEKILKKMPVLQDKNILVGTNTADDAAVYKVDKNTAIVQTVDFFTPIVDDPYDFGRIAAANSLSDIYAMGGKALFALNIVGFPSNRLPHEVLEQILAGAQSCAEKAGISIIGGHTIDDTEPKYGMAVTGIVHPDKVIKNSGAKTGDKIILTKPIGTGVLTTALKRGLTDKKTKQILTEAMAYLNKSAAETMVKFKTHACTDVTGFGLIGHLHEMAAASGLNAQVDHRRIAFLTKTEKLVNMDIVPGGTENNLKYYAKWTNWHQDIPEMVKILLNDAQTSGGLLIALPESEADNFVTAYNTIGEYPARIIGEFSGKGSGLINIK